MRAMRVVSIRQPGDESVLGVVERPTPDPSRSEIRVRVHYAGVNRADLLQRRGLYPAPPGAPTDVPGLEYMGLVDALGPGATSFAVGDRVYGLVGGGSYAEYVVVHEREAARVPDGVPDEAAAAIPEAFVTAYDALVVRAGLVPGENLLVHAVGSGVGTAGLQIGKALGCYVAGTSRSGDKLGRAEALGLDLGVAASDAAALGKELSRRSGRAFDVVLDLLGGGYVAATLPYLAPRARVVVVGLTAGVRTDLDLALLLMKRLTVVGTVLRSRPLEEKILAAELLRRTISPWLQQGKVQGVVDKVFPMAEAGSAHRLVESNATFGKVLLQIV
jgi:putative PIG3 family NAD(P)H quinone oxidoreductase